MRQREEIRSVGSGSAGREVEVRFRLADIDAVATSLRYRAGEPDQSARIVDHWCAPRHVRDYVSHERWLVTATTSPVRIRESFCAEGSSVSLHAKRPIVNGEYETNAEAELSLASLAEGLRFVDALGYHGIAKLTKERIGWVLPEATVCLDSYAGFGHVLEIEANPDRGASVAALSRLGAELGVGSEDRLDASPALTLIRSELRTMGGTA